VEPKRPTMRARFVQGYPADEEVLRRPSCADAEDDVLAVFDRSRKELRIGLDRQSHHLGFVVTLAVEKVELAVVLAENQPNFCCIAARRRDEGPRSADILRRLREGWRQRELRQHEQCKAEPQ